MYVQISENSTFMMQKYYTSNYLHIFLVAPKHQQVTMSTEEAFHIPLPFILHVGKCTTQNSQSLNAALITNQNNTLISPWLNIKHQQHYEEHMSLFSIHYEEGVSTSMGSSLIGHQMVIMWHVVLRGVWWLWLLSTWGVF